MNKQTIAAIIEEKLREIEAAGYVDGVQEIKNIYRLLLKLCRESETDK